MPMLSRRAVLELGGAVAATSAVPARAAKPAATVTSRIIVAPDRIWVPVTIGGQGPFRFILDTGASVSGIAVPLAQKLGLRRIGSVRMNGIGGLTDMQFYEAKDVVYGGGIRQGSAAFGGLDLPLGGGGLLAAGLFTTHDSDLDCGAGEWRVHPQGRDDFSGLSRLPGVIEPGGRGSARIVLDAVLDGQKYRLLADTGAPGEVLLFSSEVRRSGLWSDDRPFSPTPLQGIGGTSERIGRIVRAGHLAIGEFTFDAPLVRLYDPKDFNRNTLHYDGIVGLAVLQRLDLSTEVRKARLWARRNDRQRPAENYRLSGVWLDRGKDGKISVAVVGTGSPAAAAGLRPGDVLAETDWRAVVRALDGPPGSTATLTVGGTARTLELRRYL